MSTTTDTNVTPFTTEQMADIVNTLNSQYGWAFPEQESGGLTPALVRLTEQYTVETMRLAEVPQLRTALETNGYYAGGANDPSLLIIRDAVVAAMEAGAVAETPAAESLSNRTIVERVFRQMMWPLILDRLSRYGSAYQQHMEDTLDTITYQFSNWKRGVYRRESPNQRLEQYVRRIESQGKIDRLGSTGRSGLREVLTELHRLATTGEAPKPVYIPQGDICDSSLLTRGLGQFNGVEGDEPQTSLFPSHSYWGNSDGRYYLVNSMDHHLRVAKADDFEMSADVLRDWVDQYATAGRGDGYAEGGLDRIAEIINTVAGYHQASVEVPVVDSLATLIEFLLSRETPNMPDFYVAAVTMGATDFLDAIRAGEDVGDKVNTLRREVRKYGYLKFSGRGIPRMTMAVVLDTLSEKVKDQPLTPEEWQARYQRYRTAVQYVAGRYGEVQDMCSVLEKATAELGLEPIRKPKRLVRMEGEGLTVDVPVETWRDTTNGLVERAQQAWNSMSSAERLASVVEQKGVHVNWASMRSVF